jgi:hypothetical protein
MKLGTPTTMKDVVNTFDPAPLGTIGSVDEQRGFMTTGKEAWNRPPTPSAEAIEEARKHPNGWVYVIDGHFSSTEHVPPTAIVGAWRVDAEGRITGEFVANPKYVPAEG